MDLRVGNGVRIAATAVGSISFTLPSGLVLSLDNVYCVPTFRRNIISISLLDKDGFNFVIGNGIFSIYRNEIYYGSASKVGGLYILDFDNSNTSSIYNVNAKRFKSDDLNQTLIWHCRLGHINEKRISALHKCGLLIPFEFSSIENAELV